MQPEAEPQSIHLYPGKIVQSRVLGFGFASCVYCENEAGNASPTVVKLGLNEIMSNKRV